MKAKKVVTGIAAALSLLALTATGALALDTCESGNVTATGAGFAYANGRFVYNLRSVTLTCDAYPVGTAWTAGERTFVVPATPDKDGVYAAALTALADGRKIKVVLQTAEEPVPGTNKGWIRLLHVLGGSL